MAPMFTARLQQLFARVRRPDGRAWTLKEVARETGLSVSYIWRLRSGKTANPTRDVMERLARFFGVPVTYFLDDSLPEPGRNTLPPGQAGRGNTPGPLAGKPLATPIPGDVAPTAVQTPPAAATTVTSTVVTRATPTATATAQAAIPLLAAPPKALLGKISELRAAGRLDDALRLGRQVLEAARGTGDGRLAGEALTSLGETLIHAGQLDEALERLEEALQCFGGPGAGAPWVSAMLVRAQLEYLHDRFERAYLYARLALDAARLGVSDERLRFQALFRAGTYARRAGRLDEARELLLQAVQLGAVLGDAYRAPAVMNLGLALLDGPHPEEALPYLEMAMTLYARLQNPVEAAKAQHNVGLAYERLGRWHEAAEALLKSLGSAEALGSPWAVLYNHMELGWCCANLGLADQALRHGQAALALAQEHGWPGETARAHWHLARVLARLGRPDEAARHYEAAVVRLEEMQVQAELSRVLVEYGDLLMEQGELRRAAELYRRAATLLSARGTLAAPFTAGAMPVAPEAPPEAARERELPGAPESR